MTPIDRTDDEQLAAARALSALFEAAGLADLVDPESELLPPSEGEVPLQSLDWLLLAAEGFGAPLELVQAAIDELDEWLERGAALLTSLDAMDAEGAATSWLVVRPCSSGRARIEIYDHGREDHRELAIEELCSVLGQASDARRRWIVADPAAAVPERSELASPGVPMHPLRRLMRLLAPDRTDLFAVAIFAVVIGILLLATPVAVQSVVNFVALGGATSSLIVVVALLFLGLGFANVLSALQTYTVEILQRRLFVRSVAEIATRLPKVAFDRSGHAYGPELVNRYFDVATIQKTGSFLLLDGLSLLLSVLIGLALLAFYDPLLLAFDVILLTSIVMIVLGPIRSGIKTAKAESSAKYEMAAWLEELAMNPILFKSSGVMKSVFERSDRLARKYVEARRSHFRIAFGQGIAALVLQVVASTALLGIGGLLVIKGTLTLGQLVAAELIVTLVLTSVTKLGKHLEAFYDLMAATDKLGMVLDVPVERSGGEHHFATVGAGGAELALSDVAWTPPGSRTLFQGVSLQAASGERVGIRGPSGAGKSLLLQLVWALREPTRGSIRLDGRDLRELSLESLRRNVGLVDRTEVLDVSIRRNVGLGRPFVSDDAIRDALRQVGLLEEVARLTDGMDTELRFDGRPLASGQIARLQLARAIACRPRLLLVADIFEALELPERQRILDLLFDPDAPWSVVFVSNDVEALTRCDTVYTLDGTLRRTDVSGVENSDGERKPVA